ncbi:MAG: hypothetical protein PHT12_02980 [Patescibacteria group bacterium]|nr:hypothetical protein [Patescibacteria group bacterium]
MFRRLSFQFARVFNNETTRRVARPALVAGFVLLAGLLLAAPPARAETVGYPAAAYYPAWWSGGLTLDWAGPFVPGGSGTVTSGRMWIKNTCPNSLKVDLHLNTQAAGWCHYGLVVAGGTEGPVEFTCGSGLTVETFGKIDLNWSSDFYSCLQFGYAAAAPSGWEWKPSWWPNAFPAIELDLWNPAPAFSGLGQFKADKTTVIAEGESTDEKTITFKASVSSPEGHQVGLQVEAKPIGTPFDGSGTLLSDLVPSGSTTSVTSGNLVDGQYHWRARAVDDIGRESGWNEFGAAGNTDFIVSYSRHIKVAVVLAEPNDISHKGGQINDRPCKLEATPAKTYSGHSWDYYNDLKTCVQDYYNEQAYGKITLDFTILDNGGAWYKIPESWKTESYYAGSEKESAFAFDAIAAAGIDETQYDVVIAVHAGEPREKSIPDYTKIRTVTLPPQEHAQKSIISEGGTVGHWAHELGHAIGVVVTPDALRAPDLYEIGGVEKWDVMASGSNNGGITDVGPILGDGTNPAPTSSFTRIFLGWLNQRPYPKSAYGDQYRIGALEASQFGGYVTRYNLEESDSLAVSKYYLLETRTRATGLTDWDTPLPETPPVYDFLLYYVDDAGDSRNPAVVTIPGNKSQSPESSVLNDGVLAHGEVYRDLNNLVKFTDLGEENAGGGYEVRAQISMIDEGSFEAKYWGAVLSGESKLMRAWFSTRSQSAHLSGGGGQASAVSGLAPSPSLLDYVWMLRGYLGMWLTLSSVPSLILLVVAVYSWWRARRRSKKYSPGIFVRIVWGISLLLFIGVCAASIASELLKMRGDEFIYFDRHRPDPNEANLPSVDQIQLGLHLQLNCPDGRHVGMNYATGEFENQVDGSLVSGDNGGAPEWIYVPAIPENAGCRYSVSAHDNEAFLAANPDIAAQIPDPSDSYSIYARTIDPATGILTSATLEDQVIQPGVEVVHEMSVDETGAPVIEPGVVDDAAPVTGASVSDPAGQNGWHLGPVTVTLSADDGEGTGVTSTEYSVDGGLTWTTYAEPFEVSGDGSHTILYGSRDNAGNSETTKSLEIKIDSAVPNVSITAPADGLLTNQPTVTVSGSASDSGSGVASVSVNGANCEIAESIWTCAGVQLTEGANVLTATVTDTSGNSTTVSVSVTLDTVAPDTTIGSGPAATTTETSAAFAFAATEEGSAFSCSLDGAAAEPCASPKEYSGLALGAHSFSVYASDPAGNADQTPAIWNWTVVSPDQDNDGVLDADDDCPAVAGAPERNGCPFADRTNVDMRIIDSAKTGECGYRPDGRPIVECTRPLAGVTVKVFDRDNADFISAFGGRRPAKHLMDDIYESGVGLVGACVTDAAGTCLAGEDHPGRFLVVMKYSEGTQSVYTGKLKEFRKSVRLAYDAEDDDDDVFEDVNPNFLTLTKNLHVIKHIKKNGEVKLDGGKLTVVTGSRLDVLRPDYVVWSGEEELYPFVLTADDNGWTVDACLEVPAGYEIAGVLDENGDVVTTADCVSTVLRNESRVFLFRAVDVGSPEPDFGLTLTASHPGKAPTRVNATLEGMRSRMEAGIEKGVRSRVKALVPKWSARAAEVGERAKFPNSVQDTKKHR